MPKECSFIQGGSEGGGDIFWDHAQTPKINQAVLTFDSLPEGFSWFGWTSECYRCRLEELPNSVPGWAGPTNSSCAIVSATFHYEVELRHSATNEVVQKKTLDLNQRGAYVVSSSKDASGSCCEPIQLTTTHHGVASSEIWGPFVALFSILAALAFGFWWVGACRHPRALKRSQVTDEYTLLPSKSAATDQENSVSITPTTNAELSAAKPEAKATGRGGGGGGSARLESLDTFRGMSLTVMIFVNYGGGGYWWLDHSSWDGLTVADLLFPWFMWIMGVSMALALKTRRTSNQTRAQMLIQICRRSATLVAIGLFLDAPETLGVWRFPGVLQYFGFSYLWCSLAVVLTGSWDGAPGARAQAALGAQAIVESSPGGGAGFPYDTFIDLRFFWREWAVVAVAPAVWLALTFGLHVPGCGRGFVGAGGRSLEAGARHFGGGGGNDHDGGGGGGDLPFEDCTGGAHRYVDLKVFGTKHVYGDPTCATAYECATPYDPEGLVGAFNAVLLTYLGLVAGRSLIFHSGARARVTRLLAQAFVWLLVGATLCGFKQHGGAVPVNKNLWSLSFVLVTAGLGCVALASLFWIVDHLKLWSGAPFKFTGMNSIVVYAGSEILEEYFPFHVGGTSEYSHWGHLFANAWGAACWNIVATYLYHRRIFVKI